MFVYSENYEKMKLDLYQELQALKTKGYHILSKKYKIVDNLFIDKITIKSIKETMNRLILSTGLHGIEGYVGHSCLKTFFNELLSTLKPSTEVIIYHGLNPFGMKNLRRTNENNVDLNRNFSSNNFNSKNEDFNLIKNFFIPKSYHSVKTANLSFYASLTKLVAKHGFSFLNAATLKGQKSLNEGLCYSGSKYQESTKFVLAELDNVFNDIKQVVWIDIHTGYGPTYQMSIINSQHEKMSTNEMIKEINYPLVLGLNAEDFYEIDGDMLEKSYYIHKSKRAKCNLYSTCFEFGTYGDSTVNSLKSLKALVFENNSYFKRQTMKFNKYAEELVKEQFLPSSKEWRIKAEKDFLQAMKGIITYKGI